MRAPGQDSTDGDAGNGLAIQGIWRLGKLQRSLALMMLTWATRLQDPVLSSQVWQARSCMAAAYAFAGNRHSGAHQQLACTCLGELHGQWTARALAA